MLGHGYHLPQDPKSLRGHRAPWDVAPSWRACRTAVVLQIRSEGRIRRSKGAIVLGQVTTVNTSGIGYSWTLRLLDNGRNGMPQPLSEAT